MLVYVLGQIAEETGALYFAAPQAADLARLYERIGEQLAGQYAISYASNLPADGTERRLTLAVGGAIGARIYRAPGEPTSAAAPPGMPAPAGGIPDWVPAYPLSEPENVTLRPGSGSFSFAAEDDERQIRGAYAAKPESVGWRVTQGHAGGYWVAGSSPDGRRSVVMVARTRGGKTAAAVGFVDAALATDDGTSPPEGVPGWVPIYPGKVENARVQGSYAVLLNAAGYAVAQGHDGGYFARATQASTGRSIAATASSQGGGTRVVVLFERPGG